LKNTNGENMQKLFDEVATLDRRCYEEFELTEDILMEHAANGMAEYVKENFAKNSKIIVACGSGNNGADGIALARLLHVDYDLNIFYVKKPKSKMALIQEKRANAISVPICKELCECDVLIDSIVGTGFNGEFDLDISTIIKQMNVLDAYKIACDVPSGYEFYADTTLTMGALKKSIF